MEQPLLLLGHRDADQEPVDPRAPRPRGERVELERRSVRGIEPPPNAARGDPVLDASEVVIVEPEPPPHRLLVGEVEHLRGGQPLVDEVEQPPDDAEHRVRLPERAVGRAGRGGRAAATSAGSASSSSSSSKTSPAPNVAWMSGAKVSMSGHMTMTSRGSSVSSSSRRCRIASLRTSTWRARPWQAWTCTLRSLRVQHRPLVWLARQRRAGGPPIRPHVGLQVREKRARPVLDGVMMIDVVARPENQLHLPRVLPPRGEQPVRRQRRGRILPPPSDRDTPLRHPLPQRRRRMEHEHMHVPPDRQRAQHVEMPRGQPRQPEERQPRRQIDDPGLLPQPRTSALNPLGRIRNPDPRPQPPPELRLPHPVGRHARRPPPAPRHEPSPADASAYRSNSSARCRTALNRRARRAGSTSSPDPPRCAAKLASHGSPRHPSTTSSRAQTARSGNHGSASASIPDAVATASPTSLRGDGKSTFAHTPSPRPSPAPSRSDIRCASHRSIPRVGTATTSGANGSGSGSASSARSASTRPSARSARWT